MSHLIVPHHVSRLDQELISHSKGFLTCSCPTTGCSDEHTGNNEPVELAAVVANLTKSMIRMWGLHTGFALEAEK
jgi:hypothetical protein